MGPALSRSRERASVRAVPFAQVADGFVGEGVEAAGGDILLELLVPRGGVEAQKPIAERGPFAARQLLDCALNLRNGAHAGRIPRVNCRARVESRGASRRSRTATSSAP